MNNHRSPWGTKSWFVVFNQLDLGNHKNATYLREPRCEGVNLDWELLFDFLSVYCRFSMEKEVGHNVFPQELQRHGFHVGRKGPPERLDDAQDDHVLSVQLRSHSAHYFRVFSLAWMRQSSTVGHCPGDQA